MECQFYTHLKINEVRGPQLKSKPRKKTVPVSEIKPDFTPIGVWPTIRSIDMKQD